MPAAFRRLLAGAGGASVVLTQFDQCLAAYPPAEWARLEVQLSALPAFSKPVKALTRLLTSRAADCELDSQGRILLPPALRQAAGLGREAVLVGVLNRFEIWAPEPWDDFVRESEQILDDVTLDIQWPVPPEAPQVSPPERPSKGVRPQAKPKR